MGNLFEKVSNKTPMGHSDESDDDTEEELITYENFEHMDLDVLISATPTFISDNNKLPDIKKDVDVKMVSVCFSEKATYLQIINIFYNPRSKSFYMGLLKGKFLPNHLSAVSDVIQNGGWTLPDLKQAVKASIQSYCEM